MAVLPPPAEMAAPAWRVAAAATLMAVWWISEAIPVAATALVPLVLFPLLGVLPIAKTAAPYANPLIFLFLGGFMIALAMQRWNLHRRIALAILARTGTTPSRLVGGFMLATAGLSMWVSNTATTVMMLPIGLSVIALLAPDDEAGGGADGRREGFAAALLLGIAYAASIGGVATLIGTPPNALLAAFLGERYGIEIGFARWMLIGLPVAAVMLAAAWGLLTQILYPTTQAAIPGAAAAIAGSSAALGRLTRPERRVAAVFAAVAAAWVLRPVAMGAFPNLGLSDPAIAVAGALAMFVLPAGTGDGRRVLDWDCARQLPWGVLILFGGGLSLAAAINDSGLAAWIGTAMAGFGKWPVAAVVVVLTAIVVFLTELTSNTATAATFLPLAAALATAISVGAPFLAVPAALAASCAFMMPVATPPNAIVFGSGLITVPQMVRAGLWLNLVAIAVIAAAVYTVVRWALVP